MAPRNLLGLDFLGLDFLELGFLPLLLTALVGASCASPSDDRDRRDDGAERTATVDRQEPTAPRSSSEQFFIVERLDLRKCAWPWCGGVFVKEVNEATSSCADGSTEADC
jgi:hypothetical protein